jgi:hypothetical protein
MSIYTLEPIHDPRWGEFLDSQPEASVFHRPAWLQALKDTYGYESVALTTTVQGRALKNGIVFCLVKSWLTGARMVSLPFSDHCQPLVDSSTDLLSLYQSLDEKFRSGSWKYIELRPLFDRNLQWELKQSFGKSASYCFHRLDLERSVEDLYKKFHKNSVQQPLQRAQREGLVIEHGRSERLLQKLYKLLLITRRRHQLPPQPFSWFRNLARCFGDDLVIWIASKDAQPVAGILTLACKDTVVYKYGCSDSRFHRLGGMPSLIWHAIQFAKQRNVKVFEFGRSDLDNQGLINFKDHWGATRSELTYYRYMKPQEGNDRPHVGARLARRTLSSLPDSCLVAAGRLLYRHIG